MDSAERGGADGLWAGVGHPRSRALFARAIEACRRQQEPLGHTLLTGPAGVGKSSLARALARELGTRLVHVLAPAIKDGELIVRQLCALEPGDVLFLDELHALPASAAELLYDALERGELNVPVAGPGWEQGAVRVSLPPFTLIGATTDPDRVASPLLGRFVYRESLDFYDTASLTRVLHEAAEAQGVEVTAEAAQALAAAAHDTPRDALRLLRAACDVIRAGDRLRIDATDARRALAGVGRRPSGLDDVGARYLAALEVAPGCLGLRTLAAKLGLSMREVAREVEPYLIRRGWVEVTSRGRRLARRQAA